jgi:hypothetical protein
MVMGRDDRGIVVAMNLHQPLFGGDISHPGAKKEPVQTTYTRGLFFWGGKKIKWPNVTRFQGLFFIKKSADLENTVVIIPWPFQHVSIE